MPVYDYIPSEDEAFRTWAESFRDGLVLNPGKYMISPAQAASVQSVVDAFVLKLGICSNEATRTGPAVAEKDDSRAVCETLCRQYAILFKENGGISDADKIAIGVRPINPAREPRNAPATSPLLNIVGATPGMQQLRYSDSATPDSKAKPFAATSMQLFVAVTETPDAPLSEAKFYNAVTRNPVKVEFTPDDNGKFATYYARWCSARGETGPWSIAVSMVIAA